MTFVDGQYVERVASDEKSQGGQVLCGRVDAVRGVVAGSRLTHIKGKYRTEL